MTTARSHALYRFYDTGGTLLYVGITLDPGNRWRAHRDEKPWWHEVTSVTIEVHPTRDAVLEAERTAIKAEKPRYNVVHNRPGRQHQNSELEQYVLALVGADPFSAAWGEDASHMPDDCHDVCVQAGTYNIYFPHLWNNGIAHYTCAHGHTWTCGWGHNRTGAAPQNRGTRQTPEVTPS